MKQSLPDYSHEMAAHDAGYQVVAGVDEVGRGPWAGPVVASAVVLNRAAIPDGLNDSKRLSAARRMDLAQRLAQCADVGIGEASVDEIDALNILQASYLAMQRALENLPRRPDFVLVDGRGLPPSLDIPAKPLIKGDGISLSIAAASIVAKVNRDATMVALSQQFPGYGWETNMGYGTKTHSEGLKINGVTQHHRRSFRPIHNMLRSDN